jgi:flagellar biosynthesis/type III secretory pathway protein FliH
MKKAVIIMLTLSLIFSLTGCIYSEADMKASYNSGYDAGYEKGKTMGYDDGWADGYTDGYKERESESWSESSESYNPVIDAAWQSGFMDLDDELEKIYEYFEGEGSKQEAIDAIDNAIDIYYAYRDAVDCG